MPNVLVVSAKSPFKSVQDVLNQARKDPGKLSYGSGGNGSSQHIAGSMFKQAANVEILHVRYKGGAPAVSDLMAGQIDIMLDTGSMGHIQGGSLRALAVASAKRVPALPQVPTFAEAGLPGLQAAAWYGVTGPAGIPKEIVGRLNGEFNKLLKDPVVAKRLQDRPRNAERCSPFEHEALSSKPFRQRVRLAICSTLRAANPAISSGKIGDRRVRATMLPCQLTK